MYYAFCACHKHSLLKLCILNKALIDYCTCTDQKVVVASSCLQGKCTSVLVETEKNAHSQSNAVSFAVTIFLSGLTGSELCLLTFKNLTQSGED